MHKLPVSSTILIKTLKLLKYFSGCFWIVIGDGYLGDIALDDISITDGPCDSKY